MYRANYFIFKNSAYGLGTKVRFNDKVKIDYFHRPYSPKPVFEFVSGYENGIKQFNYTTSDNIQRASAQIKCADKSHSVDDYVIEIVEPVFVEFVPWQKKALNNIINGNVKADVFGGVVLYIVVMIIGALFFARFIIWIFATVVFAIWLLNQYRT